MDWTADAETLHERRALAHWVRNDLAAAGLTIAAELSISYRIGAVVDIDEGNDAAGGVWVSWQSHPRLRIAAVELVAKRLHEAAHSRVLKHEGAVLQSMCNAMLAILRSAGYEVVHSDDEYRPYALKVISRPAKSLLPEPDL